MKKPGGLAILVAGADKAKGKKEDGDEKPYSAGMDAACEEIWSAVQADEKGKFKKALKNLVQLAAMGD